MGDLETKMTLLSLEENEEATENESSFVSDENELAQANRS